MRRERVARNPVLGVTFVDQRAGEPRVLGTSHQPPHDVAAEDVDEHVEVEVLPLERAPEARDVARPHPVRRRGQQCGLGPRQIRDDRGRFVGCNQLQLQTVKKAACRLCSFENFKTTIFFPCAGLRLSSVTHAIPG